MKQVSADHLDTLFNGNDRNYRLARSLFAIGLRMPHVERMTQLPSLQLRRLLTASGGSSPSGLLPNSIDPLMRGRAHVHFSLLIRLWRDSAHGKANYAERFSIVFESYLAMTGCTLATAVVTANQALFGIQQFEARRVRMVGCQRCGADTAMSMEIPGRHAHCGMCKMGRPTSFQAVAQVEPRTTPAWHEPSSRLPDAAVPPAPRKAEVRSIGIRERIPA